jgi:hypothetical protein
MACESMVWRLAEEVLMKQLLSKLGWIGITVVIAALVLSIPLSETARADSKRFWLGPASTVAAPTAFSPNGYAPDGPVFSIRANNGVCPTFYTWSFSPGCAAPDANHDSRTSYCNAHPAF